MSEYNFNKLWKQAQHIPSPYMPKKHARLLYDLALENQGTMLEIGSWHGRSSIILGSAVKSSGKGHLYCLDHWNLIEGGECIMNQDIWKIWNDHVLVWQLQESVTAIRAHSEKAGKQWPENKFIDLLFIDGCHEYLETGPLILSAEVIKEYGIDGWIIDGKKVPPHKYQPGYNRGAKVDFQVWAPKVRAGGILIMHDLNPDFAGVEKVWQEDVESSNEWTVKYAKNNIGVAQKL
jgi:hypothetical protein